MRIVVVFPAPFGPKQPVNLACRNRKRQPIDRQNLAPADVKLSCQFVDRDHAKAQARN